MPHTRGGGGPDTPEKYRAALRAEYARLGALRAAELQGGATAAVATRQQHDEHGGEFAQSARGPAASWKVRHTNDEAESPASGMTAEEKFTFDLSGFFVRPAILSPDEIAAVREQVYLMRHNREALPRHEQRVPGGASSLLIDHPRVIEVLEELYGGRDSVRLEHAMAFWRERGERESPDSDDGLSQGWHQGGPELSTSPVFGYQYQNGKIYPGMVRVIFELGEVSQKDGGTHFIAGSHKANFSMHPAFLRRSEEDILDLSATHSPLIAGYDCPAGSAIFFTEHLCQCVHPPAPTLRIDCLFGACLCVLVLATPSIACHHLQAHKHGCCRTVCLLAGAAGAAAAMHQCRAPMADRPPTGVRAPRVLSRGDQLSQPAGSLRPRHPRSPASGEAVLLPATLQLRGSLVPKLPGETRHDMGLRRGGGH